MTGRIVTANKGPAKLPIVGKIRVGEKRTNGNGVEYPVSLDYFKATGDYATKFHQQFGEKPTNFGIVFISDDANQNCNERYELRDKKTGNLLGYGDGVNFKTWNPDEKEYEDFEANTPEQKHKLAEYTKMWANGGQWVVILTIEFVIPKIATVMGLWKLETKGVLSSIPNIRDTYDEVKSMAGTVVNMPFDLQIKKVTSQRPGDKRLYPVVALIPNVGAEKIEEVNQFLQQGNSLRDIKKFLARDEPNHPKVIEQKKHLQIEQGKKVKAELFDNDLK